MRNEETRTPVSMRMTHVLLEGNCMLFMRENRVIRELKFPSSKGIFDTVSRYFRFL